MPYLVTLNPGTNGLLFVGEQLPLPPNVSLTNEPSFVPTDAVYRDGRTRTLYATRPLSNFTVRWRIADSASGCEVALVFSSFWPSNDLSQIPAPQLGEALFGVPRYFPWLGGPGIVGGDDT